MTIYNVEIKMPHSGSLTRSQVITVLKNFFGSEEQMKEQMKSTNYIALKDANNKISVDYVA